MENDQNANYAPTDRFENTRQLQQQAQSASGMQYTSAITKQLIAKEFLATTYLKDFYAINLKNYPNTFIKQVDVAQTAVAFAKAWQSNFAYSYQKNYTETLIHPKDNKTYDALGNRHPWAQSAIIAAYYRNANSLELSKQAAIEETDLEIEDKARFIIEKYKNE